MKTPGLIVAFLLSVTVLLLIPPAGAQPIEVRPSVVNEGQSILIVFIPPDNSSMPALLNVTIYYGGVEQDSWNVTLNASSYSTSYAIPAHWYYGGYSVRVDFGGASYFADFQYRMSDEHILQVLNDIFAGFRSTASGVTTNSAEMLTGVAVGVAIWSFILLLFFQNVIAHNVIFIGEDDKIRKYRTDSWIDRVVSILRRIRTGHPGNTTMGRVDAWKISAQRDRLNEIMSENPRTRNMIALKKTLDDIYKIAEETQARDVGSVRMIGSETPDGSPADLLEAATDNNPPSPIEVASPDPSIEKKPRNNKKRSKPREETVKQEVPEKRCPVCDVILTPEMTIGTCDETHYVPAPETSEPKRETYRLLKDIPRDER